jgi:hypothetical protein
LEAAVASLQGTFFDNVAIIIKSGLVHDWVANFKVDLGFGLLDVNSYPTGFSMDQKKSVDIIKLVN